MQVKQVHGFGGRRILHLTIGLVFTAGLLVGLVRDSYGGGCTPDNEDTKWSRYKACSKQHESDRTACQKLPEDDKELRSKCWTSAMERLKTCNSSNGKTLNKPDLIVSR